MKKSNTLALIVLISSEIFGQSAVVRPEFEVASVRSSLPLADARWVHVSAGQERMTLASFDAKAPE